MATSGDRIQIVISALDQTTGDLNKAKKNVRSLQADIARLDAEVKKGNTSAQAELDQTIAKYKDWGREAAHLKTEQDRLKAKLKGLNDEAQQTAYRLTRAFDSVTRRLGLTNAATTKLRYGMERLDEGARSFAAKWSAAIDTVNRKLNTFKSKVSALARSRAVSYGGMAVGLAAGTIGAMGIRTASQLEQSQIAFETMMGSAKKAQKMMAWLKETTMQTPFELQGLTMATQRLLAFGFSAKDARKNLITIGDAAAATGLGAEGIDRISLALGQMQGKQKIQSQEMRQLTEAGIPAWELLSKKIGMTVSELMSLSEKKGGGAEIFNMGGLDMLLQGLTDRYGGLMEKQINTLGGRWSNLMDTLNVQAATFLESTGLKDWLKTTLASMTTTIANVFQTLTQKVNEFKPTFIKVLNALKNVFKWITDHKQLLIDVYLTIAAFGAAFVILTKVMEGYRLILTAVTTAQMILNGTMAVNPVVLIIFAIAALIALLVLAYRKVDWFRNAVDGAWQWIQKAVDWFVQWFKTYAWPVLRFVFNAMKLYLTKVLFPVYKFIFRALGVVIKAVWAYISKVWWPAIRLVFRMLIAFWRGTVNGAKRVWNGAVEIFRSLRNRIGDIVQGIKDRITGIWDGLTSGLQDRIQQVKDMFKSLFPGLGDLLFNFAGGPISAGDRSVVGEIGPEMFVPFSGAPQMLGEHGAEIRTFNQSGVIIPNHLLSAMSMQSRGGTATMTGAPTVTIESLHVADEFDVEAAMTRAMLRADRIARERR